MSSLALALALQLPAAAPTVTAAATAVVGAFVAYQGYRGYRRNDSRPMLYLAIGILLLTTPQFLVHGPLVALSIATRAQAGLVSQLLQIAGLVSVLYSFTNP